jgi:hypothetical protein
MNYTKLILSIILIFGIRYIYEKWNASQKQDKDLVDYDLVRKYLLDEKTLGKIKKPILWIHISYNINARKWENFNSRNTYNLNQPYLYLTIKSIINHCGNDFHICLIDDRTIQRILPNWNVNLTDKASPIREHLRGLALTKILYNYGGLLMPASFVCLKSPISLFSQLNNNNILVGEFANKNGSPNAVAISSYSPNIRMMACRKESEAMREFSNHLEYLNSTNYTSSYDFLDLASSWCADPDRIQSGKVLVVSSKQLGVEDNDDKLICIDRLMGNKYIKLSANAIGLYIPEDELLKRTAYNWFVYLPTTEVLTSDTLIGKYLLISQK